MMKTKGYQPSKDASLFWFSPACGTDSILCNTKRQQALRMKLHQQACSFCKTRDIVPVPHGATTIEYTRKTATTFPERVRDIVEQQQISLYDTVKIK